MFPEGGGFVNITVPEGGPTATGMNLEGGTAKKKLPCTPPAQVNFWNSPKYNLNFIVSASGVGFSEPEEGMTGNFETQRKSLRTTS